LIEDSLRRFGSDLGWLVLMLAGLDFLVEVLDQVIDLGRRLVIGCFFLEVKDNVGALGDVLVGEERVEEVLELHQALL